MTIEEIYENAKRKLDKNEITIGEFAEIVDVEVDAYKPPIGHNCNEDYADCDQFVCSECGIELQDWHRVERDLDDGDISYHEYTFKFCPNCGARMTEGEKRMTRKEAINRLQDAKDGYKEYLTDDAIDLAIKALEQESCEDCISRADVLDLAKKGVLISNSNYQSVCKAINELPSVTPTRKKAMWEFEKSIFDHFGLTVICPSCRKRWKTYDEIRWKKENRFCPNCGARMTESEE